jgi:hypothetical protein
MTRLIAPLILSLVLTACGPAAQTETRRPQTIAPPPPIAKAIAGLDGVIGKNARSLTSMFGSASQDVFEADARRLQFAGTSCILDAYLYPPAAGKEAVVTYVDARTPDGRPAERASCVSALQKGK